jgi:hypothetical protein
VPNTVTEVMLGETERPLLKTGLYQVLFKSEIRICTDATRSTLEFDGKIIELTHSIFPIVIAITRTPCACGFSGFIGNQVQASGLCQLLDYLAQGLELAADDMQLGLVDEIFPPLLTNSTPSPVQPNRATSATNTTSSILTDSNLSDTTFNLDNHSAPDRPRSDSYDEVGDFDSSVAVLLADNADGDGDSTANSSSSQNNQNSNNDSNEQADSSNPSSSSPHDTITDQSPSQPSAPTTPTTRPRNGTSARGTNRGAADWVSPVKLTQAADAELCTTAGTNRVSGQT